MKSNAENFSGEARETRPELELIPGQNEKLLSPSPLLNERDVAIAAAKAASDVKESFQQLLGISDRHQIETLADRLRREGVKLIFQSVQMLPSDQDLDEANLQWFNRDYESANMLQEDLNADERDHLFDSYGDEPAARAAMTAGRIGVEPRYAIPMLRTILIMLDNKN